MIQRHMTAVRACALAGLLTGLTASQVVHAAPLPKRALAVTTTADDRLAPGAAACTTPTGGPAAGKCSLRAAIELADGITPYTSVTITIPANKTRHYVLTLGELDLTANDIQISGGGAATTVVDANHQSRVFNNSTNAAMTDISVINGAAPSGAGILDGGMLSLNKLIISNNVATGTTEGEDGGGIQKTSYAPLIVTKSTITANSSTLCASCTGGGGGGLSNRNGTTILTVDTFSHNTACAASCAGGAGGAIYNTNYLQITGGTFTCNTAGSVSDFCANPAGFSDAKSQGGAIWNSFQLQIAGASITKNSAGFQGGGIYSSDTVDLTKVTLDGNRAGQLGAQNGQGGGLFLSNGALQASGGSIGGNTAGDSGGALSNSYFASLTGVQMKNNVAGRAGGAVYNTGEAYLNAVTVTGNRAGGAASGLDGLGGAIYNGVDEVSIAGGKVTNNVAANAPGTAARTCGGLGGGIFSEAPSGNVGVSLSGTDVSSNTACNGAGIYNSGSTITAKDATIKSNHATNDGGGVFLLDGSSSSAYLLLDGGSLSANKADQQTGGIFNDRLGDFYLANGGKVSGNTGGSCPNSTLPCA